jgi:chitinase domain-containing protein 1
MAAKHQLVLRLLLGFIFLLSLGSTSATLSKSDKKKNKESEANGKDKPLLSVVDRGLVSKDVKWKNIANNYQLYSEAHATKSQFSGNVLGYVTPWNSHGYDIAKSFSAKFAYVSPVWLQLVPSQGGLVSIQGGRDIDKGWMKDVKRGRDNVKIVPRLLFEGWSANSLLGLFRYEDRMQSVAETIAHFLESKKFDGCVLEIWSQLGGHYKGEVTGLVEIFSNLLHSHDMELILVIPSKLRGSMFEKQDFDNLVDFVDAFSLMTYDYSNPNRYPVFIGVCTYLCQPLNYKGNKC